MAIVKVIKDGPCTIYVHDDAIVQTNKEAREIFKEIARICGMKLVEITKNGIPLE